MFTINENGIERTFSNVKAVEISTKFETPSVQLEQTIESVYPGQRLDSEFGDGIFDNPRGESFVTKRITFGKLNKNNTPTLEAVQAQLNQSPNGCIFHVYATDINAEGILTQADHWAIEEGRQTLDFFKCKYENQDSDNNTWYNGRKNGKIVTDENGNKTKTGDLQHREYKRSYYARTYKKDIDRRQYESVETAKEVVSEDDFRMG